jgi:hypothetical protein
VKEDFWNAVIRHFLDFKVVVRVETRVDVLRPFRSFPHVVVHNLAALQNEDLDVTQRLAESTFIGWLYGSQKQDIRRASVWIKSCAHLSNEFPLPLGVWRVGGFLGPSGRAD